MPVIANDSVRDTQTHGRGAMTPYRDVTRPHPTSNDSCPCFDGCIRRTLVFLIALCVARAATDFHRATYTLETVLALGLAIALTAAGSRLWPGGER